MKPLLACLLFAAATALVPLTVGAAPRAQARQTKPGAAKSPRRSAPVRRLPRRDKAFILNGTVPGGDPNRLDHMAIGQGMHPERMDHMNAVTPVPTAPAKPKRLTKP